MQYYTVETHSWCLRKWERPIGELGGFFHMVIVIYTNKGPKKEREQKELISFYNKVASFRWDPDRWRWFDGGRYLNYTTKDGREFIANRNPGATRAEDKCERYLPGNYKFYWSQIWNTLREGKEAAFIWSIWHKAVAVSEWRARIAPASISKQCVFCLPNTSESIKHIFWVCI